MEAMKQLDKWAMTYQTRESQEPDEGGAKNQAILCRRILVKLRKEKHWGCMRARESEHRRLN